MKKIILATVFAAALSSIYAAPIFGQSGQQPVVNAGKVNAKPIGKIPLETINISSATDKGKNFNVQIMPSMINGLKIGKAYLDKNNKTLFVRVENEGLLAKSEFGVLVAKISYAKYGQTVTGGGKFTSPKVGHAASVVTLHAEYVTIEPIEPKKFALLFLDFKDFKGDLNLCVESKTETMAEALEYLMKCSVGPMNPEIKPYVSLEIITKDSKGK